MKENHSTVIRKQGVYLAFDHGQWEFQSRQFASSAIHLLNSHIEMLAVGDYKGIPHLPTAQFLISLAIELVSKAYYLKKNNGPKEAIYKHEVLGLCEGISLDSNQQELMLFAERYFVWAGRYPTPKWTKEKFKEEYDVPCHVVDGVEHLEAKELKNSASPQKVKQLCDLYSYLQQAWKEEMCLTR